MNNFQKGGIVIIVVISFLIAASILAGVYFYFNRQLTKLSTISEVPGGEKLAETEIGDLTGEQPPEAFCQNECSRLGERECIDKESYHICSYDAQNCLKWSPIISCLEGTECQTGDCVKVSSEQKSEEPTKIIQCSSGSCCNLATQQFRPASYVCCNKARTEYGCPWGEQAGSNVGVRYQHRYCSGSSADCNGLFKWSNWVLYKTCSANEKCEDGECIALKCTDGTPYGECSSNKPKYCSSGVLIDKASTCGCPTGYEVEGDKCNKKNVKYESIIFALNESFADMSPNWEQKADALIDKVNYVFSKTTDINFTINKYLTYNDSDYTDIFTYPDEHPEYYIDLGDRGGITYILLIHEDGISNQKLKELYGSDNVNVQMTVSRGGKSYELILDGEAEATNILYNPLSIPFLYQFPVHELGHCFGLAAPEWYFYKYSDCTHLDPKFEDYSTQEDPEYKDDPMTARLLGVEELQFNQLNSTIINRNLNREFSYEYVQHNWFSKSTKVHVTDREGNSIQGATVKVFCVRKGCFYCSTQCKGVQYGHAVPDSSIPIQTLVTDKNGYVTYEGPSGAWEWDEKETTPCIAKAIKVYFNDKSDVKVVNFLDLQKNYVLNNSNEHVIHIILE